MDVSICLEDHGKHTSGTQQVAAWFQTWNAAHRSDSSEIQIMNEWMKRNLNGNPVWLLGLIMLTQSFQNCPSALEMTYVSQHIFTHQYQLHKLSRSNLCCYSSSCIFQKLFQKRQASLHHTTTTPFLLWSQTTHHLYTFYSMWKVTYCTYFSFDYKIIYSSDYTSVFNLAVGCQINQISTIRLNWVEEIVLGEIENWYISNKNTASASIQTVRCPNLAACSQIFNLFLCRMWRLCTQNDPLLTEHDLSSTHFQMHVHTIRSIQMSVNTICTSKCMNEYMNNGKEKKSFANLCSFKCELEMRRGTRLSVLSDIFLSWCCHALMLRAICGETL